MPRFSKNSLKHLESCHPDLQMLFLQVVYNFDCTIIGGHRGQEEQDRVFNEGFSKVEWPNSKHNESPSMAVDVTPYPIDWQDTERMSYFAGYVMGLAAEMKRQGLIEHHIRSGIDWDRDTMTNDQEWSDLPHFELA